MTKMEKMLEMLAEPMSVQMMADQLGQSRQYVQSVVGVLRMAGCVTVHHTETRKGSRPIHHWIATGKAYASVPRPHRAHQKRREWRKGSGVIAPRPYAYGLMW